MARQPAPPAAGRTAEEQAAVAILGRLVPAARAEARAQVRAGRGRGLVLCDQTGEVRIWYVPAAGYAAALPPLPAAAREDLALLLPVYDPATEAVLVMLTRAAVQPLWLRPGGEIRGNTYPQPAPPPPAPGPGRPPARRAPLDRPAWATDTGGRERTAPATPQGQPITQLGVIAAHIAGMLEAAREQYATLELARPTPWVLDDAPLARVRASVTTQQADLGLCAEQLRRWHTAPLTPAQRQEVDRLGGQLQRLQEVVTALGRLVEELSTGTLEKQWAKSDIALWIAVLRQDRPPEG